MSARTKRLRSKQAWKRRARKKLDRASLTFDIESSHIDGPYLVIHHTGDLYAADHLLRQEVIDAAMRSMIRAVETKGETQ